MYIQDLFYPEIEVEIGNYVFTEGITLKIYSDREAPTDWGKLTFSNPYKEKISIQQSDEIIIKLGYDGKLQEVFLGSIVKGIDGSEELNEVLFKDRMLLLERTYITDTFLDCTPQEIITASMKKAGVVKYELSQVVYLPKRMLPVARKNVVQLLDQINAAWNININGNFIKGIFYWGVIPEQEVVLEFEYGNNIISLDRNKDAWELTTVSIPSMQHSQKIKVTHPKVSGIFETKKIIFETNADGFIRTRIYFKEQ